MTDIPLIAREFADAHARKAPFEPLTGARAPEGFEEAYAIQRELIDLWRTGEKGPIAGYKVALTSKAVQEMVGVDQPCGGAIFATTIHPSGARVSLGDYGRLGLEFEVCFSLAEDLPGELQPYTDETVRDAVKLAVPAFELIDDRAADYGRMDAYSLIADNCWCGGVVLGESAGDWTALDLASAPCRMTYNDEVETGTTGAALDNPLNALAWLANLLADQGRPLEKGMIVMTGSALKTRFPVAGDTVRYDIAGMGHVTVTVGA